MRFRYLWLPCALLFLLGVLWPKITGVSVSAHSVGQTNSVRLPPQKEGKDGLERKGVIPKSHLGSRLFEYIDRPAQADAWEKNLSVPADSVSYVRVDPDFASGKKSPFWKTGNGGVVEIPLPDGRQLSVVLQRTQQLGGDGFVSEGALPNEAYSRAIFSFRGAEMSAMIEVAPGNTWEVRAMADGVAQVFQVNPEKVPPCGVTAETNNPQKLAMIARAVHAAHDSQYHAGETASSAATTTSTTPSIQANAAGTAPTFTILFAYTDAVAALSSADAVQTQAQLAVSTLNSDLARSHVDATATLVAAVQISYDETKSAADKVQSEALDRLANPSDGYMDNIHALRDQYAADLVSLALARHDSVSAGVAYVMATPGQSDNSTLAFSVVDYGYMNTQSVFSHEIGHNFGCAHDRENAKDSAGNAVAGAYPYSYGYRFNGANGVQYRTIMAYAPGTRLSYFSNPDIIAPAPVNVALGIPAGQTGEADNARTIRQDELEVSNFRRDSAQVADNFGQLLNVSTRAMVGTGAQQLIGGFVVGGNQSKRVLLRAIGPTLSQYGVNGVLANPTLRLVHEDTGVQIDQNDDWGSGPNAAAVAAAIAEANAFTLPNGSRDSAIVAALGPGPYTANVEGVNGSTGIALIEAYDLDLNSGRVVNLSTRGYASIETPMIGGFIVKADPAHPNQAKHIVIRVLGPSLANYGVTGAMDDPTFSLHDNTTAQILFNDDWSVNDQSGTDDTKPAAVTYSEKALAATGLTPGNRRDSAVLVNLLPGSYTAVVQPFQQLPDQPEQPGVALVEVYEITQ